MKRVGGEQCTIVAGSMLRQNYEVLASSVQGGLVDGRGMLPQRCAAEFCCNVGLLSSSREKGRKLSGYSPYDAACWRKSSSPSPEIFGTFAR